jgi:hypothetical protein
MATRVDSGLWYLADVLPPQESDSPGAGWRFRAFHPVGWWLSGSIGERDGIPVILNIALEPVGRTVAEAMNGGPTAPDDVVTGQLLHSIPMGRLVNEMIAWVVRWRREHSEDLSRQRPAHAPADSQLGMIAQVVRSNRDAITEGLKGFPLEPPKRGRNAVSDGENARIANAVLALQNEGTKHIVLRLKEKESRRLGRDIPLETVRTWVKRAVKREYLIGRGAGAEAYMPGPALYQSEAAKEQEPC